MHTHTKMDPAWAWGLVADQDADPDQRCEAAEHLLAWRAHGGYDVALPIDWGMVRSAAAWGRADDSPEVQLRRALRDLVERKGLLYTTMLGAQLDQLAGWMAALVPIVERQAAEFQTQANTAAERLAMNPLTPEQMADLMSSVEFTERLQPLHRALTDAARGFHADSDPTPPAGIERPEVQP